MNLHPIPEVQCEVDQQELIEKLMGKNRFLEKRCNYYKRKREFLIMQLNQAETPNKLSESKVSVSSANCNLPTMPDETDLIQKYQEELQQKETLISELKETVLTLENKVNNLQACNDEMQYQLSKQQHEFIRSEKVSQSVIIPKSTSQTEKAMAVIDKFVQPISTSSFKSTDGKPQSAEEKRKLIKKMSIHAGASAYMMAMKGDYTTLQNASEEIQSNKSLEQS
ncbi:unnamed protein product [Paramecium pentaurelia]|uniref:Uncharacterized protein n=1 Tax=Paramecium pentaurelia TaxID=43138 RepID=A0A8S1Y884_9CILI|nr:unnamed protein product [Paramecium pentaurelia]